MTPSSDASNMGDCQALPVPSRGGALEPRLLPLTPSAASVMPPPVLSAKPNVLTLLQALRRRLLPALLVGLVLAAGAGAAAWFLMPPPKLTARTQLHVAPAPPAILFPDSNHGNDFTFLRTQAYLLTDRFVLSAALRSPEIAGLTTIQEQADPIQWLEKEVKVDFPSPEFIHITLSGDRPADLLKIVSAVTKSYMDNVVNKEHNDRLKRLESIRQIFDRYDQRSREKRTLLSKMQKAAGGLNEENMAILQKIALDDLRGVRHDLTQVRHELRHIQAEMGVRPDWADAVWPQYVALLTGLPLHGLPMNHALVGLLRDESLVALASPAGNSPAAVRQLNELIDQDAAVLDMRKNIERLKVKIEQQRQHYIAEAFEVHSAPNRAQLAALEEGVRKRREELRPQLLELASQNVRTAATGSRQPTRERYLVLRELEKVLEADAQRLDKDKLSIADNAVELAKLKEDIAKFEGVMQKAGAKIDAMEIEQEAPARITQPDTDAVLYTPDNLKKKLGVTAGATGGVLALVLLAFAWLEFLTRKVHSPQDVAEGLGLQLVGTVPDLAQRRWLPWLRPGGDTSGYTHSLLTESVDAARTLVLHTARTEKLQIVMITSALAGEGKTSLASHLAASLARAGRRTLLLDSDLRNPTLHRLFELHRTPGLSEYLRGEMTLDDVIRPTPIANLSVISAGQADAVALQTLALDAIPQLFQQLRPRYDFIVVDSCPVLPVADALLVGQHSDAVIFSLLREVSRLPRVYAACQRLTLLGIRLLGAVVNGTQEDTYGASYHYVSTDEPE